MRIFASKKLLERRASERDSLLIESFVLLRNIPERQQKLNVLFTLSSALFRSLLSPAYHLPLREPPTKAHITACFYLSCSDFSLSLIRDSMRREEQSTLSKERERVLSIPKHRRLRICPSTHSSWPEIPSISLSSVLLLLHPYSEILINGDN